MIVTLYMDTVKYAAPVEMQNPLKSWNRMTAQHGSWNGSILQLERHLTFRCRWGRLSQYANGYYCDNASLEPTYTRLSILLQFDLKMYTKSS
jgi:hypothetical protein